MFFIANWKMFGDLKSVNSIKKVIKLSKNKKLNKTLNIDSKKAYDLRSKLDNIFLHPFWGTIIFFDPGVT